MNRVKMYKKCVNPSTRPNVSFNNNGVCSVCELHQLNSEGSVDWLQRKVEIEEISDWRRRHSHNSYDCIVTVSGGKDSTRQTAILLLILLKQIYLVRDEFI